MGKKNKSRRAKGPTASLCLGNPTSGREYPLSAFYMVVMRSSLVILHILEMVVVPKSHDPPRATVGGTHIFIISKNRLPMSGRCHPIPMDAAWQGIAGRRAYVRHRNGCLTLTAWAGVPIGIRALIRAQQRVLLCLIIGHPLERGLPLSSPGCVCQLQQLIDENSGPVIDICFCIIPVCVWCARTACCWKQLPSYISSWFRRRNHGSREYGI